MGQILWKVLSLEGIVGLVSFLLCAVPFLIFACFGKNSSTPLCFWAGDNSLKDKVTDLTQYNQRMAKVYGRCAAAFLIDAAVWLVAREAAMLLLGAECTVGFYVVYRAYKKILSDCSRRA